MFCFMFCSSIWALDLDFRIVLSWDVKSMQSSESGVLIPN